jgi:hypothetical protein
MDLKTWIKKYGATIRSVEAPENPMMIVEDNSAEMDHWFCTIGFKRLSPADSFKLYFSKGIGLRKEKSELHRNPRLPRWHEANMQKIQPNIEEVLECLHSDFCGLEASQYFDDWAENIGWDSDSRKAEKCYQQMQEQMARFQHHIGPAALTEFLNMDVE